MVEQPGQSVVTVETTGAKIVGVTALIFAIIAFFVPFFGLWLGVFSCVLAIYPAFTRISRVWALVVSILNAVNAFFLTPTFWIALGLSSLAEGDAKKGVSGAAEAEAVFAFFPWLWMICFFGLFALVIFKYVTASKGN